MKNNKGDFAMKIKPKCHNQEDFELDNVYNEEDEMYKDSYDSTNWYKWK